MVRKREQSDGGEKRERRWFVRTGNHVDGPHPESRIRDWHREGRIPDDALLSRDGRKWHRVRWPGSSRERTS